MNLTPLDDVLDKHFGKVGTPKRDAFESDVDDALHAYRLGEAIKKARIEQNLTQEQLGERIGVKRAQISRLERGYSITIPTMRRVFKALGVVTATIDLGRDSHRRLRNRLLKCRQSDALYAEVC